MAEPEAFVVICPITSQAGRRVGCHVQKAGETVPEGQEITFGPATETECRNWIFANAEVEL